MMTENKELQNIYKIALLVAISCVLQIAESLIPHPIPGLRLGLANVMTLIALVTLGLNSALEVAVLRTIMSSFIMGTFMSPTFILSFSGALISTLAMGFLYWLTRRQKHYRLSIIGISIAGALTHNLVQLYLAYLILVRHKGIFIFLPWLSIGAVVMGWVTGIVAGNICRKLKENQKPETSAIVSRIDYPAFQSRHYSSGNSLLHRLPSALKIIALVILSLAVLIFSNFWFYLIVSFFLIIMTLMSKTSFNFFFLRIKRCTSLVFVSFLFPIFFNSGKHVLSNIAYFRITAEGLNMGVIFALRIIFLILASSLLVRTTSPEDLTRGLSKVLSPLRPLGISQKRVATILSLSWGAIPLFGEMTQDALRRVNLKRVKNLRNLIPVLTDLIAMLYLGTQKCNRKNIN